MNYKNKAHFCEVWCQKFIHQYCSGVLLVHYEVLGMYVGNV